MGVQPVGCHCKAVASQALGLFMWEATLELHSRTCALGEGLATPLFSALPEHAHSPMHVCCPGVLAQAPRGNGGRGVCRAALGSGGVCQPTSQRDGNSKTACL